MVTITAEKWKIYDSNPELLTPEEFKAMFRMEESRYESRYDY